MFFFSDVVGGPNHAWHLIKPLQHLAKYNQPVCEKAIGSLAIVASKQTAAEIEKHMIPVITLLAEGLATGGSVVPLLLICYPRVKYTTKVKLRIIFQQLCVDENHVLRQAAASKLSELAKLVENQLITSYLLPLYQKLAGDQELSVRLLVVEACINTLMSQQDV